MLLARGQVKSSEFLVKEIGPFFNLKTLDLLLGGNWRAFQLFHFQDGGMGCIFFNELPSLLNIVIEMGLQKKRKEANGDVLNQDRNQLLFTQMHRHHRPSMYPNRHLAGHRPDLQVSGLHKHHALQELSPGL